MSERAGRLKRRPQDVLSDRIKCLEDRVTFLEGSNECLVELLKIERGVIRDEDAYAILTAPLRAVSDPTSLKRRRDDVR
mgnify:CR=1 FL=1